MAIAKKKALKKDSHLSFEGLDRQIYCWIRQQRYVCAIHKYIYYQIGDSILEDKQYDFIEYSLAAIEGAFPYIARAVTEEGYLGPNEYAGFVESFPVMVRARLLYTEWVSAGSPRWDFIPTLKDEGMEKLFEIALGKIREYPI